MPRPVVVLEVGGIAVGLREIQDGEALVGPTTLAGYGITDAAAAVHTHAPADITGYGAAGGYLRSSGAAWVRESGVAWADLTGVPTTFAPSAHTHPASEVTAGTFAAGTYSFAGSTINGQPTWGSTQAMSISGLAATATKLATARAINGVDFDGTAAITVTAAAGTLSGDTLASNVLTSSLTAVGTLATGVWNATAIGPTKGGTGLAAYTLGDTLYASAENVLSALAGNITATKKFLRQTGTGTASAAPAWDTLTAADVAAGTFPSGAFAFQGALSGITTLGLSGQLTSTLATGSAPFVVASTTVVGNLNVSQLLGATWAAPGSIGSGTPAAGAFTTLSASGDFAVATSKFTVASATGNAVVAGALALGTTSFSGALSNGITINSAGAGDVVGFVFQVATTQRVAFYATATGADLNTTTAIPLRLGTNSTTDIIIASGGATTFASTIAVTGIASFAAGAVDAPSIAATGDLNTGRWFPAADTIAESCGGTEALRLTATAVSTALSLTSTGATAGIGYGTGAGGAVEQATSRTTGVTLNKVCGAITLVSAAGDATNWTSFTVTNSTVAATDVVQVCQKSGTDLYEIHVTAVAAGSFQIRFRTTAGTTTEQPVFTFTVFRAVAA